MTVYDVDDTVRFTAEFRDVDGTLTDPTTLSLKLEDPSGNVSTFTWAAAEITRASVGDFYKSHLVDEAGKWLWRWRSTGAIAQAEQGYIIVEERNIPD